MIEMCDRVGLVANQIIQSIRRVSIDKAIANPSPCSDGLLNICYDLKGSIYAILVSKACIEAFEIGFSAISEDVGAIRARKRY